MQWLAEVCVKRPVFAAVLSLLIMVLGLAGYFGLGVDRFPSLDFPIVTITTVLPGASPEDIERDLSDRIEGAVNTIGGIDELRSISTESVSLVVVQFELEKDIDIAAQDVRDRLERIRKDFPSGTEAPVVAKLDPNATPIMYLSVKSPGRSLRDVTEVADNLIRPSLEALRGVGQVRLIGSHKRTIHVNLNPVRMKGLGIQAGEVARAIGIWNATLPGGKVDTGRDQLSLRIHGQVADPLEIQQIPIRSMGDQAIRVQDVATVEDGQEEQTSAAVLNGEEAVLLAIRKQSGKDTIKVADTLLEELDPLRKRLPDGYLLEVVRDDSQGIRTSTHGVQEHLIVGALLAALVVLLFLGSPRSTLIAALAIPTSVLGTFAVMAALGYTLNTITLLALALAVGIVIDDAIVVLENIYRYIEEKGMNPDQAAIEGTKEIGLAVLATTFSLIAVFLPVVFLAGIPGRFLRSFGITMSVAIAVSLFVSFSLTPSLSARWLKAKVHGAPPSWLERLVDIFYRPIERAYMVVLGFSMRHRWLVVLLCFASLGTLPFLSGIAKKGFLPIDDRAQLDVTVRAPEGSSVANTQVITERIAREIRGMEGVRLTMTTIGADDQAIPNLAHIYVGLVDPTLRPWSESEFMERIRQEVVAHQPSTLRVMVGQVADFSAGSSSARIQYNLSGPDLKMLEKAATTAVAELKKVPGAVDVDSSLVTGHPEIGLSINRPRAAELGVSVMDLASTLQILVGGQQVSTFTDQGEQYQIRLRADAPWRSNPDVLSLLSMPSQKLGSVPLLDVVTLASETGPATINRLNRQRVVTVTANAAPGVGENVVADALKKIFKEQNLPSTYLLEPAGQTKLMAETGRSVLIGFGLAFVFMYLILAAQFESWLHPFTILLSLPLTLPFAVFSIVLTGQSLDMFSVLGIFVLFGIVKKNSILQIDHTNHLRAKGLSRLEAIMQANKDRLRPILMTTLSFVAGMLPLVTSVGIGSGFNRATAGVVVGGQSLSLLLTLLATPVAYSLFDDVLIYLRRFLSYLGLLAPKEA